MKEMVSVIIPTYNREKVIARAVQSVLRQTYEYYEILIIDDASTDSTQKVVEQMADDRIRYIRLEENRGAAHARNVGIRESRYDYIAFLDSDDEWLPAKLEVQMRRMLESPKEVGFIYCRMGGGQCEEDENFVCPPWELPAHMLEGDMFGRLLIHNVIGMPTILVRRKCLEQSGGFKESIQCLEDWEWVLRIARNWLIGFVDEKLVEVHKSAGSVSANACGAIITKTYLVTHYRHELAEMGMLEEKESEVLDAAKRHHIYEEIKELLSRDFEL